MALFGNNGGGLFGLGGMGGMQPAMPQSLLDGYYDPAEMSKAQIKSLLMGTGIGLMSQGPSDKPINFMTSVGQGLGKGVEAAQQTGQDYRDTAMQGYQMKRQADNDAFDMDWKKKQFEYGMGRDATEDERANRAFEYGMNRDGLNDKFKQQELELQRQRMEQSVGGANGVYGNVYWGPDGKPYALNKDGSGIKSLPVDGGAQLMDPAKMAGEKARLSEIGEGQGKAIVAAPGDIAAADNALDLLNQIKTNPYLDRGVGGTSLGNIIPGTGGYDFQNLVDQAKSGAFLTAIQQMRGLGSLSNAEGQTATAAVTRMNTASSKEAFLAAVADYEKIIMQGRARAEARLGGGSQSIPSPKPSNGTLKQKYGLE
jgi:hypothetical protein